MNKTFTINLNGRVYNIDDDAYEVLSAYLGNLKAHFAGEEGAQEIMEDIEARIGELFTERMRYGMQVIRQADVEDVVAIMGHPEEIEEPSLEAIPASDERETDSSESRNASGATSGNAAGASSGSTSGSTSGESFGTRTEESGANRTAPEKERKHLFRDPDERVIAGVCSGLGMYLNVEPWIIRALFVVACLFGFGAPVLIYVLMWIIVPEAKTVAQKLQMRGESPTVENIRTAINEGELTASTAPQRRSALGEALGFIVKFFAVIAGSCLGLVALLILLMVGMTSLPFFFSSFNLPFVPGMMPFGNYSIAIQGNPIPMFVACLVAIVLPIYKLIQVIMVRTKHAQPISKGANWTLLIIWLISVVVILTELF